MMYAQDYDEWFPGFLTGQTAIIRYAWYQVTDPYIKNSQVYVCPSTRLWLAPNRYSTSSNDAIQYWGYNSALIQIPAEKFLIGDTRGANSAGTEGSRLCMVYSPYDPNAAVGGWNRCRGHLEPCHNETANAAFCDGHVKAVKPNPEMWGDTTAGRNRYWIGNGL
jgi:prepilin-type processing-associated H-X9-DG protein